MRSSTRHLASILVTGFGTGWPRSSRIRPGVPITLLVAVAIASPASADTLHVPADYATIQSCIDAAVSGQDECVVAPGTYNELINFLGKAITLRSSQGPEVTTIDGTGLNGSVVTFVRSQWFPILEGFTITGGTGRGPGFTIGGGIYNDNYSPRVINCIFTGNSAYYGGGMYNGSASVPKLSNCTFIRNTAFDRGGGVYNQASSPTLTNCTFIENTVSFNGYGGGGIFNQSGTVTTTNCKFVANAAWFGSGMFNQFGSVAATNSTFIGSEISNYNCNLSIANCTFTAESGITFSGASNYTTITSSIFWPGGFNYFLPLETPIYFFFNTMSVRLPYGADNGGNIVLDPMFVRTPEPGPDGLWNGVDDDYGDLRLQPGSPCINVGDPNFVPSPGETDLDGYARVLCGRVDMGAYEFGIGDYDCDQALSLRDVAGLQNCYTGQPGAAPYEPGCESLDFEFDGDVDLADLTEFEKAFRP